MKLKGIGIGRGLAIGPALRMPEPMLEPVDSPSTLSADAEMERVVAAIAAIAELIRQRGELAGGTAKDVLDAQALMAEDSTLSEDIAARLTLGKTAERAVFEGFARFRDLLSGVGGYTGERAIDLDDISRRVVANLAGLSVPGIPDPDFPFVLIARDLAPADTAVLDLGKILALVTSGGGPTTHTAILAREKSIVTIVGAVEAERVANGTVVIVDAAAGLVTVDPDETTLAATRVQIEERSAQTAIPIAPGALADGTAVPLLANLGSSEAAAEAVELGAEGVGLFRTELLFLDAATAPSVAEQQEHYTRLLEAFPGRKVVVRALDSGADKALSFLNSAVEDNPALGLRGLRALRANEHILRDQLAALARADARTKADLWVMAPMVSTVEETQYFTSIAREAGLKTVGVMVEVPSSALLADRILAETDFASIGTNDLTQYTLAADRLLGSVAALQDPWHPAVLRLVGEVGRAGAALGKPVGICGEAAADPLLAVVLVGLGATSLSMAPAAFAGVRAELLRHTLVRAKELAALALSTASAIDARSAVVNTLRRQLT